MSIDESRHEIDLTTCDREPIHLLGMIQDHGYLLALSADWIVCFASMNIEELIGQPAHAIIGRPIAELLPAETIRLLHEPIQNLAGQMGSERTRPLVISRGKPPLQGTVHLSGAYILLELEQPLPEQAEGRPAELVRAAISRFQPLDDVRTLLEQATRFLSRLTGFDRVMAYKFREDGAGEVVAEEKRADLEPYLGLRYPASDIPRQARELYIRNPIRCISDVNSAPVAIVPAYDPRGDALDLSHSALRSVSPVHIEYLKNMGVGASMSLSILREGRLWGLFAFHHQTPRFLGVELRGAADLFGQMFSLTLESKERAAAMADEDRVGELHARILSMIANQGSEIEQLSALSGEFRKLIASDGLAICVQGECVLDGATPTVEQMDGLVRFLNCAGVSQIFETSKLAAFYEGAEAFADRAAGLIAIPISRMPRDYLIFFRREIARTVQWAGNPNKPVEPGSGPTRLTPRKSFEIYREMVLGQCEPWAESELRLARALRTTLLEVVLKLNDAVTRERKQSIEKQELLISELNHRVRNLLGLVRGLISHSKSASRSAAEYVDILDHRIQALARAHDQITDQNWSPGSVRDLIAREGEAYLLGESARIRVTGPDVLLQPAAFSTLALVMHELVTNSAKYGALCDRAGHVEIDLRTDTDGQFELLWREIGGPAVQPPKRRGFGSTIIERSIPFDLKGEAEISFEPGGLRARLVVPQRFVAPAQTAQSSHGAPLKPSGNPVSKEAFTALCRHVLLVEDNIIIAMDAEDCLKMLGAAEVTVVSNVGEALKVIERTPPSAALLDVNLGAETSFAIADRLKVLGTPYGFASGYGEQSALPEVHRGAPQLSKPFDMHAIERLLFTMLQTSQ